MVDDISRLTDVVARASPGAVDADTCFDINTMFSSYAYDGTKGLDLYATAKKLSDADEDTLFLDYLNEFLDNDLAQFLVLNLASILMDFRFESQDLTKQEEIENWFYANDTREQLFQILTQSFVFGTGVGQRWEIAGELVNATRIDVTSLDMEKAGTTPRGKIKFKYTQSQGEGDPDDPNKQVSNKTLNAKRIFTFKPVEIPSSAWGISPMRSSLLPLQAIRQLNMDIPAGIKRLAYETLVLSLDLSGIPEAKQKDAIHKSLKSFAKYDSATNTVLAFDSRHRLAYVGTDGGGGKTIQAILPLIEPLLMFLLNKWFVPLGDVLQEKSNRALAETQTSSAKARLGALKQKFARFVEKEIISHILKEVDLETGETLARPTVHVTHNTNAVEISSEIESLIALWNANLVTRELVQSKLPYSVTEGTYLADLTETTETTTTGEQDESTEADEVPDEGAAEV